MAKSRATFNKKEIEKKKLKKKKDKEEKKEARKANSGKGVDFEDMIAYVDENGNISTTPPDPTKKKAVDPSTIQISVQKHEEEEQDPVRTGVVTFFNESKGFGFIRDLETQESVFVHVKSMVDEIMEKDKVMFEVERTVRGLNAFNVKLVK